MWQNVQSWLVYANKLFWLAQPYFSTNIIKQSLCQLLFLLLRLLTVIISRSSLFYNRSATRVQHECDTSDTNATQVQHEWDMSDASATQVQHECYTNHTSTTQMKKFDFVNDTSKNIFSHPYIYYMASERLQGEEQFHSKNYHLEMRHSNAKLRLKIAPQKMKFLIVARRCPCTFPQVTHSNAALFSIKTILCENTNVLFSKNYWKLAKMKMNARFSKNI